MCESDETESFVTILKTHNEKKPFLLYYAKEKHSTILSPSVLKPQDVIATVSKQLKDIQKADSLKKECVTHSVKSVQSDFVPINALNNGEDDNKFETQYVTDTQLNEIVDNVEARVSVNIGISQNVQTTSQKEDNSEKKSPKGNYIVNLCGVDDNIAKSNINNDLKDITQFCNKQHVSCIDEINTEVCKEFDTSYSGIYNNNASIQSHGIAINIEHCNANESNCDFAVQIYNDNIVNNNTDHLSTNIKKDAIKPLKEKCNKFPNNVIRKINKKSCNNHYTNEELGSYIENDLQYRFHTDSNMKNKNDVSEEKDQSSSPIFKSFKPLVKSNTPSPLIFPLDSFEKFESLAMPLIEENMDFEAAKFLINSQIINNQLLISVNAAPVLEESTDNTTFEIKHLNVCNNELSQNVLDTEDHVDTLIVSKQTENSTCFEDEILFSSDEENDNFHCCSKDLPLTCALKTSFNEPEINLEETVFVGFQTSSNKCIQVSKESFVKAKNLFDSIDNEENACSTITELIGIYDSNICNFNNNLPPNKVSDKASKTNTGNANNFSEKKLMPATTHTDVDVLKKLESIGFKTANGASIVISERALLKSKTIFKDIEEDISTTGVSCNIATEEEFMGFNTASNKRSKALEECLTKSEEIFEDIDIKMSNAALDIGFKIKTAGQEIQCQNKPGRVDLLINKPNIKDEYLDIIDQTILHEFENECIDETICCKHNQVDCNELQTLVDSKTKEARIKKSHAPNKTSGYLSNDEHSVNDFDLNENFNPGISQYRNIYDLQDVSKFFGFKTANNKNIKISSEALAKTKDLFNDIGFEDFNNDKNLRKSSNTSKNDCDKWASKSKLELPENENPPPIFQGFKTASNKLVKISKEALLKTEKIFQDIDSVSISKDDRTIETVAQLNDSVKLRRSISFQGFKSASKKSVNLSVESVDITKKICQNILNNNIVKYTGHTYKVNSPEIMNPNIYNYNIGKPKNLTSEIADHDTAAIIEKPTDPRFQGFKTANNKPIIVSEKMLLKTKKIFENINDSRDDEDVLFKNSEYVNLKITPDISNKNEPIDNIVASKTLGFQGFKTASDKHVNISEDALAKSRYIFKDIACDINISRNKHENETTDYWKEANENIMKTTSEIVNEERSCTGAFEGFQTASNKYVKISDEALARSRKIFDEINFDIQNKGNNFERKVCFIDEDINKENVKQCGKNNVFGFKTATNKVVTINENSLKKSKKFFSDLGNDFEIITKHIDEIEPTKCSVVDTVNNLNLHNAMDTQLLNNFEDSLHTEDFYKNTTPKQCKRSGSPILSCPKAKKRKKFQTPYRSDTILSNIKEIIPIRNKKTDLKYPFSENYKIRKLYSLKDLEKSNEHKYSALIDPYILNYDFDTLLKFEFKGSRNEFADVGWTTDNIKKSFVDSVDNKIIPEGWLDNHLKLILWKLISYEIRFPNAMRGVCSVRNVFDQLKYRYDKELYRAERPVLRKLLEKDDISTRTMILAVVGIYVDGVKVHRIISSSDNVELLVTDGWYCVKACTDKMISRLVSDGKIAVGRKIATAGAELLNCEQGVSPWEDTSAVRLKLFGNSTRPAHWDARLGVHANGVILSQLSTIDPLGGKVCKARALVVRVYPALYVEKLEDGSTVTRSERLEHLYQIQYETERQRRLEKLYEEVEKEFFDQESSGSEGMDTDFKKTHLSGSQLNRLMRKSNDLTQFRSHLTDSQARLLQEYSSKKKEKIAEELQKRVQDKIRAQGLCLGRNVIPLLKIRVAGFVETDVVKISKAMISIWRPNDAILDVVNEGTWIELYNIVPTGVRNSEIQISAGRQSVFHRSKFKEHDKMTPYVELLQRKCFTIKDLNKNPAMHTDFNEVDTVGVVFLIEPSLIDFDRIKGQQFQNVYLTDANKNFICINFWGGIKKFGYENIFDNGNVLACSNLQKRAGNTRKSIPQYRATELTVFTKTPKLDHVRDVTEELIKKLSGLDKRKFCDDCVLLKINYSTIKHTSEISPYRINNSDYSLTNNKIFIDSPLAQNKDSNLNLTGLDFESTFQQGDTQEVSPAIIKRKQLVKEKIARLKMYGEPPPLSKIHIVNKSTNAGSAYKSPLTSNVARVKNQNNSPVTTSELQNSPVLPLNKTFLVRSGVNPVKLNFSSASVADDKVKVNPFEEEFEASPPLSLD